MNRRSNLRARLTCSNLRISLIMATRTIKLMISLQSLFKILSHPSNTSFRKMKFRIKDLIGHLNCTIVNFRTLLQKANLTKWVRKCKNTSKNYPKVMKNRIKSRWFSILEIEEISGVSQLLDILKFKKEIFNLNPCCKKTRFVAITICKI